MRITVIGTGYVGLVSGACFAEFGFDVTCVDQDALKIARLQEGRIPIFEPGLEKLVHHNASAGRLHFTTSLDQACLKAQVILIAVGTPSRPEDGYADMSSVFAATEHIGQVLPQGAVVVTKSTVPLGTSRHVQAILERFRPRKTFDVVSNPEFLREGSAVDDFMRPDRVVIGCETDRAYHVMEALYHPLTLNDTPLVRVALETAELVKYASNAFLATKIAFINEIADLAEQSGADIEHVARVMGMDHRIGSKFLGPGPGYGGSCFPKDTRALMRSAQDFGVHLQIAEAVHRSNEHRKSAMVEKIEQACGGSVQGLRLGIWGITFKANTDDVRESASLTILPALHQRGAFLHVFDPEGETQGQTLFPYATWAEDAFEAARDVDALVILTEWNVFRAVDLSRLKKYMRHPLVIDLRNLYDPETMRTLNFDYISLGRPRIQGDTQG